jgi:hypothetical protein
VGARGVGANAECWSFLKSPTEWPAACIGPRQVVLLTSEVLLLNGSALRHVGVQVPALEADAATGPVMSLVCQKAGLPVLVDPLLAALVETNNDSTEVLELAAADEFVSFCRTEIADLEIPHPGGAVMLAGGDSGATTSPPAPTLGGLFAMSRPCLFGGGSARPELEVVCRSQLQRPALLARAVRSVLVASQEERAVRISLRLVTDRPERELQATLAELGRSFPALRIEGDALTVPEGRFSRTHLAVSAFNLSRSDYLWFLDDDDFLLPSALSTVEKALVPCRLPLIVGNCVRYVETWADAPASESAPSASRVVATHRSVEVLRSFGGDNHVPFCAILFPRDMMARRLACLPVATDYFEDYFLLSVALAEPGVEVLPVDRPLAGISIRPGANTVEEQDRSHWNLSLGTVLGELLEGPFSSNPMVWNVGCRLAEQVRSLEIEKARLSEARHALEAAGREMDRSRAEVAALSTQIGLARQEIVAMLESTSWRVTAPLRRLKRAWTHRRQSGAS